MLTATDFFWLPFTTDLTKAGIASTCRTLLEISAQRNERVYFALRRNVAEIATKLAFLRLIEECHVAHRMVILKPYTNPDKADILLSEHRIELVNFLITRTKLIQRITQQPESLIHIPLVVSIPRADLALFHDEDLLCFSIALGKTTTHLSALQKHLMQDAEKFLCYPFPLNWAHREQPGSMGELVMKSEQGPEMYVELGGKDEQQFFRTHTQLLPVKLRTKIEQDFWSLSYLHVPELPAGRISIYSPRLKTTCTIHAHEWGNLWVNGLKILLLGYTSWKEFNRLAYDVPAGALILGEIRLPRKGRALEVVNLYPIIDLIPGLRGSRNGVTENI